MDRPARPRHPTARPLRHAFQLDLVHEGDPVISHRADAGLEPPGLRDRIAMHRDEAEPPALIEAQRVEVVVARDEPDPPDSRLFRPRDQRVDERGPRALEAGEGVERQDLTPRALEAVGRQPAPLSVALHDLRGMFLGVVQAGGAHAYRAPPTVAEA